MHGESDEFGGPAAASVRSRLMSTIVFAAGALALLFGMICFFAWRRWLRSVAGPAPAAIVVSSCHAEVPDVRRIKADFGIVFDVPLEAFAVRDSPRDMPPGRMYLIKPHNLNAELVIWHDDEVFQDLRESYPVFSDHVESRAIRTTRGQPVGMDHWGYLHSGERWRYVQLSGDAAGYKPLPANQASRLDEILKSACFAGQF